ncbi:hypothetical protein [Sphingomonas jeddahensis]|uniref:Uncharacterized protein n=1 Tax=Sphingomonas jeddahensis TaxID=1915074 RepID=A0A1V2ETX3_9SPHN|nr:hypothetical protein [Sphingomonas jeddahensis]ONF95758.1 hypothetical protein SPHI_19590 [Sphingomonas jeddahensis]
MDSERSGTDLSGYIFPLVMLVIGVVAAALVAAMPQASLDVLVWRLGLPKIIAAAAPPIGATGRTLLALAVLAPFVGAAGLAWRLRGQAAAMLKRRTVLRDVPTMRRADAHPDHPPRRPIRAEEDLGPPLPIITVAPARGVPEPEQPLPADLDQRLASFDPISIPDVPREPCRAVPPLAVVVVPAREEDEEFAEPVAEESILDFLAEAPEPEPEPEPKIEPVQEAPRPVSEPAMAMAPEPAPATAAAPVGSDEPASLATLLERLERGAQRRKAPEPAPPSEPPAPTATSLDDTLVMLRRMARS